MAFDGTLMFGTGVDVTGFTSGVATMTAAAAAAATTITAGLSAAAIKVGSGFEASMSQVAATMGITSAAKEFTVLSNAAKEMGETTKFSASQAGEALNYLALAGYDAEKAVGALPNVLNVAAAGGMELASASDMITDAMSALGLETSQMSTFADQLAVTSQKSNTSVSQLGEAILTVGGTAKTLSGGVVEMNTALGILADNGIKGSEGGTMLRNTILSLSAPTDTAAAMLSKLGISAFDSNGQMKPLQETFADLGSALSTLTEQERTEALSTIFNKVDLKGINALLGTSAERFNDLSGYISDCTGAAAQMAATMDDNLKGDLTIMQSALEGLGIAAYEKFQEPMRTAVQGVTNSIGDLTSSLTNGKLSDSIDTISEGFSDLVSSATQLLADDVLPALINSFAWVVDNFDKVVTVSSTAAAAIVAYRAAASGAAIAQKVLNSAMDANPLFLVASALAATTAALVNFTKTAEKNFAVKNQLDEVTQSILDQSTAFEQSVSSAKENEKQIDKNAETAKYYWGEIKRLSDENGNATVSVTALEAAVSRLNATAGTNIQVINGQIQGYQELCQTMDDYIEKTRRQAKLSYLEDSYAEASANIETTNSEYEQALADKNAAYEDYVKKTEALRKAEKQGYSDDKPYVQLLEEAEEAGNVLSEAEIKLSALSALKRSYTEVMSDYESLLYQGSGSSYNSSSYKSTQQLEGEDRARNYEKMAKDTAQTIADTQAENTALLKEAWEQAEHEYATGVIASEEDLYARKSALLSQYGDSDLKEHWQYYEDLYGYQQDYSEKSRKEAEEAVAKELADRQSKWENIERLNSLGIMKDKDAIKARADFVKKYYGDVDFTTGKGVTDENYQYVKKVYEDNQTAAKNSLDEQVKIVDDGLSAIVKRYQEAYDELEKKRQSYRNKLMSIGGDIFSVEEVEENGQKKTVYTLNNINDQLKRMREYNAAVKKLRAEGMSDELLADMMSLGADDSAQFAKYLSGMSSQDRAKFYAAYEEKQKLADELTNDLYKTEAQEISDSMTGALGDLAVSAYDYGAQTAEQFSAGFNEAMKELDIGTLYTQIQVGGSNKNYENYKTAAETSTQEIRVSVDVSGKNAVYLDGKKVGEFTVDYQGEQTRMKGA